MGSLSKIAENVPNLTNLEARRPFEVSCFEFLMNLSLVQLKLRYQKENFMFCLLAADIFEYFPNFNSTEDVCINFESEGPENGRSKNR